MHADPEYLAWCRTILQRSPLFTGVEPRLLDDMLSLFRRDSWRRGVQIDPAIFQDRFYLILEGRLEVMRINPDNGRSLTLYVLGPGDGIDIVTLLNTRPHEVTPVALDDLSLISVPLPAAREWIERHPEFNRNFLPYLGEQMRKMEDLASDLALHDTITRLARLILRHVSPHRGPAGEQHHQLRLIHDLHDDALARMVGSVRQVINRHLQHWRREGILHRDKFRLEIDELEALHEHAHGPGMPDTRKKHDSERH